MKGFLKGLRFGFDPWGLAAFLLVMAPNFIWFAVPAPNDLLRAGKDVPGWDTAASVFQVLMVAALCLFKNRNAERLSKGRASLCLSAVCCACYYVLWILYYLGTASLVVILGLCLAPSAALLLFSWNRKNGPALLASSGFLVCHLLSTIFKFVI